MVRLASGDGLFNESGTSPHSRSPTRRRRVKETLHVAAPDRMGSSDPCPSPPVPPVASEDLDVLTAKHERKMQTIEVVDDAGGADEF